MKKKISIIFSLLLTFALFADEKGFTIKNYRFQGFLYEDNVMEVLEIIDVDFSEARHGIYRDIPTSMYISYDEEFFNGDFTGLNKYQIKELSKFGAISLFYKNYISDIFVQDDNFETEELGSGTRIKIGSETQLVKGPHQYVIQYDLHLADNRLSQGDIFYYAILGSQWDTTIDNFEFEIDFENPIPSDTFINVLSGYTDSYTNELGVEINTTENKIYGSAHNILPHQAISLRAELPESYFWDAYNPHTPHAVIWIVFSLVIVLCILIIFFAFKTPHAEIVPTVEFYPPENIASAEVGYIIDHSADNIDLLSLIPYFAKKGYLKITEIPKNNKDKVDHLELTKLLNIPKTAPDYQQTIFNGLFKGGKKCDMRDLGEDFGRKIKKAKSEMADIYTGEFALYKNGSKKLISIILISLTAAIFGFLNSGLDRTLIESVGIFISLGFFGLIFNKGNRTKNFEIKARKILRFLLILVGAFVIFLVSLFQLMTTQLPECSVFIVNYVSFITLLFTSRFEQMTDYNVEITGKLLGFKEFIATAEVPKLKELLNQNPDYFYDVLPYAMVFNLTGKWASQFKDIDIKEPDWYKSTGTHSFSPYIFSNSLSSHISQSFSHAQAELSRSEAKSSGHGFSGGGGGGGGGGSW